ncbi:MAG TPA: 5-formyltetrahydrofolate cyclo-ligase [Candidatus Bathyarchaeia archaeon]|nr:5-formyltetrahydrofolate cyclo-ligase [Candidatus Bathyarchaeia archaeon]
MAHRDPLGEKKALLRRALRAERRAWPAGAREHGRRAIARLAAERREIVSARVLAGYMADDGEIDVGDILADARSRGALILLPRRRPGGGLDLAPLREPGDTTPSGPGGLREPIAPAVAFDRLPSPRVLLAPAVAVDRLGNRLGRGGGDYDRLLAELRPAGWYLIGVCHAAHLLERVPVAPHDVRVDAVLTESGFLSPPDAR